MKSSAPVLLLVFNRIEETQKVVAVLKQVKPSRLYVAADGPRSGNASDHQGCKAVRDYLRKELNWEMDLVLRFQDENMGSGKHVSSAISWFFEQEEEGIILEDDCIPALSFFKFCGDLLQRYKMDDKIQLIGGTNYFSPGNNDSYYFSDLPQIWGWATWRRAWKHNDFSLKSIDENRLKQLVKSRFKNHQLQDYWLKVYRMMKTDPLDAWDYQWTFSMWNAGGIAIIPAKNLISNVGYGELATHTKHKIDEVFDRPTEDIREMVHPKSKKVRKDLDLKLFFNNFEPRKSFYFLRKLKDKIRCEVKKLIGIGKP